MRVPPARAGPFTPPTDVGSRRGVPLLAIRRRAGGVFPGYQSTEGLSGVGRDVARVGDSRALARREESGRSRAWATGLATSRTLSSRPAILSASTAPFTQS